MCGVPYHAAEGYIARLIQKGYRVAICDQMEDPSAAKKLVKREITRIVTPGTATDARAAALAREQLPGGGRLRRRAAGVAYVDVSTGEFRGTEMAAGEVPAALESLGAREVLVPPTAARTAGPASRTGRWRTGSSRPITPTASLLRTFPPAHARRLRAGRQAAGGRGRGRHPALPARHAASRRSIIWTGRRSTTGAIRWCSTRSRCAIWNWSSRCSPANRKESTLLCVLDRTATGMGGRLLRQRLLRPSLDRAKSKRAWTRWSELLQRHHRARRGRERRWRRFSISSACSRRLTLGTAGPRDLLALGRSLARIPALKRAIRPEFACARLRELHDRLDEIAEVRERDSDGHRRRAAAESGRRRHDPRRLPRRNSTSCATSAATASSTSRRSKRASASAPASGR